MLIMGIDQSYNSSGIVILDENDNIIHAECYKPDKNKDKFAQAYNIALHIASLVDKFNPDILAIEGLAFGIRGNATRDLGGLQFVIVSYLQEVKKRTVEIIPPLTVKKMATGNGRSKKNEMIDSLPKYALEYFLSLGVKKTTGLADLCDAFNICKCAKPKGQ